MSTAARIDIEPYAPPIGTTVTGGDGETGTVVVGESEPGSVTVDWGTETCSMAVEVISWESKAPPTLYLVPKFDVNGNPRGKPGYNPLATKDAGSEFLHPVEWKGFFQRERKEPTFTIPVLVPEGRQTAVFAVKKLGKSLLTLDVSAAAATGRSVLGEEPQEPISVVYLDMEMTEDDLWERLLAMGYGPDDEAVLAQWFHYYLLPALPALDTAAGGDALMTLVDRHSAAVIVIDTTSRVISGRENDADTFHSLYRHTGLRLKQAGVGLLRLDHAGHNDSDHARGSSAKGTDVDTVYQLTKRSDGKLLLAHKGVTRVPWLPDNVIIERQADPLRRVVVRGAPTADAEKVVVLLKGMALPVEASVRACEDALKAIGSGKRHEVVADAVRLRRAQAVEAGEQTREQAS